MRQRKAKDLETRMEACGRWLIREVDPDAWEECFPGRRASAGGIRSVRPLYAEIGCGKGDFLIAKALQDSDSDYIGIEGQETVILRAIEKAIRIAEADPDQIVDSYTKSDVERLAAQTSGAPALLDNLRFACCFVHSMTTLFTDSSLSGLYLNFSDPWPKTRHTKRRLTYRGRLREYAQALKPGGFLECKTDNDDLFTFTLGEIAACDWTPEQMEWDLHSANLPAAQVTTEYENQFLAAGKKIHYVRVAF